MKLRQASLLMHRYVGLMMTAFLVIVGLTGSLLAFWSELNHALTPGLFPATRYSHVMPLGELAETISTQFPNAHINTVYVDESGSALIGVSAKFDGATGKPYHLDYNQIVADAATGKAYGVRTIGGLPRGVDEVMPFVYHLHFALVMGEWGGGTVLGIVALAWTLDCFVSIYLTLPARRRTHNTDKPLITRWKSAWLVRWKAGAFKLNFDLHRTGGLWFWLILLVFAWSSVGFNLNELVYRPVMSRIFKFSPDAGAAPRHDTSQTAMGWLAAQQRGQQLMHELGQANGFDTVRAVALYHNEHAGQYTYRTRSTLDFKDRNGSTEIAFDDGDGHLLKTYLPSGHYVGDTVSEWLYALHTGNVFGLPYRIFVSILGGAITMISVTGAYIWWKKRKARMLSMGRGSKKQK